MARAAAWPIARAALIAVAIGLGLLQGCPLPERKHTPGWALGLVARAESVRETLLAPVAWVGRDLDITQRWSLFRGAARSRYRLYLEGKGETGDWQLLHRAGDADHDAYGAMLAYRRMRGTYNPSGPNTRGQYRGFATWMILHMLDDHPEFVVGRTRMERLLIGDGDVAPTGEFTLDVQERRRRK